ncbi:MAG: hypothetical protein HC881_08180 [Leptolyngbyaceae cyanobacterium SL_7_1]|nr:hypothetical protein [Leptolyngbyaceae cyanobacterium SL_7_1]
MVAGVFAFSMDLVHPFSSSKDTANFIKAQQLEDLLIAGSDDVIVSPIAALLDKEIFYLELNQFGSFIPPESRQPVQFQDLFERTYQLLEQQDRNILLILNYELTARDADVEATELAVFDRNFLPEEKYYLYLLEKKR